MASLSAVLIRRSIQSLQRSNFNKSTRLQSLLLLYPPRPSSSTQWLSLSTDSTRTEFSSVSGNAYELLGVSETSSFAEIKASFRKLAKETHPDLADSDTSGCSQRFIQILAAYEILSDSEKRAHYDRYLLSQKNLMQRSPKDGSISYTHRPFTTAYRQMEVVEWLKWYRCAVNDIVSQKKVVTGTGYFDILERDVYSAMHAAYYGPEIDSMDFLPDRFEAEERSVYDNPEVLHLVSGRDLFGMVSVVDKFAELSFTCHEKLASSEFEVCQHQENANMYTRSSASETATVSKMQTFCSKDLTSDAYKDLELHIFGRLVATASRLPPKSFSDGISNDEAGDQIHIFLNACDSCMCDGHSISGDVKSRTLLGTITGLGTSPEEGSCFVLDSNGRKTHVIVKHRTYLVKHMHWYQLGGEISVCECRSTRARLPPSKFWLFEPRCGMHDVGGWYVETFGKDEKNKTVLSRRYWDGFDAEQVDQRLHPALYLIALAYRTLDLEAAKKKEANIQRSSASTDLDIS